VDDDSTIFGSSFEYASGTFQRSVYMGPRIGDNWDAVGNTTTCAGGEVHAVLQSTTERMDDFGDVTVHVIGSLYEDSSCYSEDLDGRIFRDNAARWLPLAGVSVALSASRCRTSPATTVSRSTTRSPTRSSDRHLGGAGRHPSTARRSLRQ